MGTEKPSLPELKGGHAFLLVSHLVLGGLRGHYAGVAKMPSNSEQTLLQEDSLLEGDKAFNPREELNGIRGSLGSSLPSVWWDGGVHGSAQRGHCKEPGPGNHKARPSDVFSLILFFLILLSPVLLL